MSRLYGTIQESERKTKPTARGHRTLGVTAASWKGSIKVRIYVVDNVEHFTVVQEPWHGHGVYQTLAKGIVGQEV